MKNIVITGASSGLGHALAVSYANPGINLYLTGRNEKRLKLVAKECENKGASIHCKTIDITNTEASSSWISSIKEIDLIIANAGVSAGTGGGGENHNQVKNIFSVNIDGVLNTIWPAIDIMQKQGYGQIAIVSSLAGYRGLPGAPAYSASKAAVKIYGEGLRGWLQKYNIGLTVITPGYIKTPMTDINKFPMPFLMSAEKAASIIKNKLQKNPARIAFPFIMYQMVNLLAFLPPCITDYLFNILPEKE